MQTTPPHIPDNDALAQARYAIWLADDSRSVLQLTYDRMVRELWVERRTLRQQRATDALELARLRDVDRLMEKRVVDLVEERDDARQDATEQLLLTREWKERCDAAKEAGGAAQRKATEELSSVRTYLNDTLSTAKRLLREKHELEQALDRSEAARREAQDTLANVRRAILLLCNRNIPGYTDQVPLAQWTIATVTPTDYGESTTDDDDSAATTTSDTT